ncbi:ABC transporter permease [Iamia sp. SCSIO 61187]|uniref:ABC transporter permease n=1 Tax=Iamia sp. SCSIO 61187 TaxID=2722752 RepID=UPI001C63106A|nr:ABC transporter permease [Iamia sp. SCSIO 61187]QYG92709.1 ABC transporter permease [Iamia sp. SCSIO 61187]
MRIALREMRRRPGRFAVATVILTLISMLLMFLGGLLDGLVANSTGALRAQQADAIVYSATSQDSLVRSRIEPDVRSQVEEVVGAESVGGFGSVQLGGRLDGRGPRDLVPIVLFGYELAPRGLPDEPPGPGEVYADEALRSEDIEEGTTIRLGPARSEVTVVGFLEDSRYSGQGTLWGSLETWREVVAANRPAEATGDGVVQALVVREGAAGGDLAAAVDAATDGATSTLSIDAAIDALPGVSQQTSTFNQIIGVTVLIAIVVVALFFALLTVERVGLYGILKAIGASSRTLFLGVLTQAVVVALLASAVGIVAALALDALVPPGSIPFVASPARLGSSAAIVVAAAAAGCAFSLRRVLRVDPAAAIGGSQ